MGRVQKHDSPIVYLLQSSAAASMHRESETQTQG